MRRTSILQETQKPLESMETGVSSTKWLNKPDILKVKAQFKNIQIKILNMFTTAKTTLSTKYQHITSRIRTIQKNLHQQNLHIIPQFWNLLQDIQLQLDQKTNQIPSYLDTGLISSFCFDHLLSLMSDSCTSENYISHRRINSSFSSGNRITQKSINQTVGDIQNIGAGEYRTALRVKPDHRRVQNLGVLSGKWDVLEELNLENKKISNMVPLSTIIADTLQQINLKENELVRLDFMIQAEYPILRNLNLSKNLLISVENLQLSKLTNLKILNLSSNKLRTIHPLSSCNFPQLIQLNLSDNRLEQPSALCQCTFPKLQILNLDNNSIKDIDFIARCCFYRLKILSFCFNAVKDLGVFVKCKLSRLEAILAYNNDIESIDCLQFCQFGMLRQLILNNNCISDIGVVPRLNFQRLAEFDLENNRIRPKEILCFVTKSQQCRAAKKKYPFIQL